jgi:hypothetical protein
MCSVVVVMIGVSTSTVFDPRHNVPVVQVTRYLRVEGRFAQSCHVA